MTGHGLALPLSIHGQHVTGIRTAVARPCEEDARCITRTLCCLAWVDALQLTASVGVRKISKVNPERRRLWFAGSGVGH